MDIWLLSRSSSSSICSCSNSSSSSGSSSRLVFRVIFPCAHLYAAKYQIPLHPGILGALIIDTVQMVHSNPRIKYFFLLFIFTINRTKTSSNSCSSSSSICSCSRSGSSSGSSDIVVIRFIPKSRVYTFNVRQNRIDARQNLTSVLCNDIGVRRIMSEKCTSYNVLRTVYEGTSYNMHSNLH